jgi:sialic acid synthase SpsE
MPDPILVSIAAALIGKAAAAGAGALAKVFRLTREKPDAAAAMDAADQPALAAALQQAADADPAFAAQLHALWPQAQSELHAEGNATINKISGTVSGHVLQARDIQGGVTFGPAPTP